MTLPKSILLLSYICIASIAAAIITPAIPQIEQYFQLGTGAVEWIVSIFLVGYTLGQLIYGPISNRFGRLTALRVGLGISLVGLVVCIASVHMHSFGVLLAGRFVNALGASAGLSCVFTLINELSRDEKQAKSVMSLSIVSFTAGVGLAVTIGGLVTQYWHWQDCFWLLMVHGVVMFCATFAFDETLKEKQPIHIAHLLKNYSHALKSFKLVVFSLAIGLTTTVTYAYSAAAPLIAHHLLRIPPSEYGYWTLMPMFASLMCGFASQALMKKMEPWHIIWIGMAGIITGLLSLYVMYIEHSASALWFFITLAWIYFTASFLLPAGAFYASNAIKDKASASSMMSFLNLITAVIGVSILGYIPGSNLRAYLLLVFAIWLIVLTLLCLFKLRCPKK